MTRAATLAVTTSDFVRTAEALGLPRARIMVSYIFHNAMLPILTTVGIVFSTMLGANVLVEKVFAWPGIASYALDALLSSDYAAVQGFVLMIALIFVVLNLVIDLLYSLADPRTRFLAADDLIDRAKAARLRRVLEEKLGATLEPMERPIPPESIWSMRHDYEERLTKTSRARTIYFESRREAGARAAERLGLVRMMRSASFGAFAEALSGRKLASGWGLQVLRYGPGDYAGPHNDHHPENKDARDGYIDLHLSLCSPGVAHQWLVYSRAGHFSEIVSVARPASLTAYRLPFWHYTTPLAARRGRGDAARWVLLGTFLYR